MEIFSFIEVLIITKIIEKIHRSVLWVFDYMIAFEFIGTQMKL